MNWILLSRPPLSSDPDNPPKFGTCTDVTVSHIKFDIAFIVDFTHFKCVPNMIILGLQKGISPGGGGLKHPRLTFIVDFTHFKCVPNMIILGLQKRNKPGGGVKNTPDLHAH